MRLIFDGVHDAVIGQTGRIRVEMMRAGLPSLADERGFCIVQMPPVRTAARKISAPPFLWTPVEGPHDQLWTELDWPDDHNLVASAAQMDSGVLMIYYSTIFPRYATQLAAFERRDAALARSFTERYKIWLAVHSLLIHKSQEGAELSRGAGPEVGDELMEAREREERCRVATLSTVFAAREVQMPVPIETE